MPATTTPPSRTDKRQLRLETIRSRARPDDRWPAAPLRINAADCIACDACQRACPPHFGAIVNSGLDVKVIAELCSGCGMCLRVCPIGCIHPDDSGSPTDDGLWSLLEAGADPYLDSRDPVQSVAAR
jgi:electron transport complex protein RnfB